MFAVACAVIERMEYAPALRKKQFLFFPWTAALGIRRYTYYCMLLPVGWIVFFIELVLSLISGLIFRRFWSQATITPHARKVALIVYSAGCICILLITLALPL